MTQTVDLGGAMRKPPPDYGPLAELIAGMRASITADLRASLLEEMTSALSAAVAQISVAPAQVAVTTPEVTVNIPGEDDAGEIEAMDRQTAILTKISGQLADLLTLARTPVITEVQRDSADRITQTRTHR